jgi:hypothetical protein
VDETPAGPSANGVTGPLTGGFGPPVRNLIGDGQNKNPNFKKCRRLLSIRVEYHRLIASFIVM